MWLLYDTRYDTRYDTWQRDRNSPLWRRRPTHKVDWFKFISGIFNVKENVLGFRKRIYNIRKSKFMMLLCDKIWVWIIFNRIQQTLILTFSLVQKLRKCFAIHLNWGGNPKCRWWIIYPNEEHSCSWKRSKMKKDSKEICVSLCWTEAASQQEIKTFF